VVTVDKESWGVDSIYALVLYVCRWLQTGIIFSEALRCLAFDCHYFLSLCEGYVQPNCATQKYLAKGRNSACWLNLKTGISLSRAENRTGFRHIPHGCSGQEKVEGQVYPRVPEWTPAGKGPELGTPSRVEDPKLGSDDELRIKLRRAQRCSVPLMLGQSCTATAQGYLLMAQVKLARTQV
jgi:hypothetical protein